MNDADLCFRASGSRVRGRGLGSLVAAGIVLILGLALASSSAQQPERRVALVIGNGTYPEMPLRNPVNDSRAMATALKALGFDVIERENVTQKQMQRTIGEFGRKLAGGGVGLFYYAGHGMQVGGKNYLIPIDAAIQSEADVRLETVDVDAVLDQVRENRLNIVILDACRNNPFERRFRGEGRGLAVLEAPVGTLIAYATAPGKVARDGDGEQGLYTNELLRAIGTPGLKVEDIFKRVRAAVARQTRNEQIPWESSSLTGDFYFVAPASATPQLASPAPALPAPQLAVTLVPRQDFGTVAITSTVPGVDVWLGSQRLGETRPGAELVVSNLPAGTYQLRATRDGYRAWMREVQVAANRRVEVAIDIEALRPDATPTETQKKGGVLRVGILGEPPSLDAHWTTASLTETLANHVYEGLYTLDESYRPIPMLAESLPAVSKDDLTYTIRLRQGIRFHNGKEMTSEDVVASLRRWGQQSVYGKDLFIQVADLRAADKHTVELRLKARLASVLVSLATANNFAAIYPKEVAEKFRPQERITEYVGTGPFKFAEWKRDQYIRMVRFDDYKPRSERPNGYGGGKTAWVDEIRWIPVPEVVTRVAQVETGELDFADDLNLDAFDRLKANANVKPIVAKPHYWLVAVFNKKEGLMTNQKLRQAWQAAIDIEPIMRTVAGGRPEFYRMDSSLAPMEIREWHTRIAGLPWNERNKEKAKKLLQEAGYKREPIRFMTTREYKWMYDFALLSKQQLEDAGFTIDLQVVDWATLVKRRNNPKEYDVFTTGMGAFYDPTHHIYLTCGWPGWTCDEEIQKLQAELARETDPKKRYTLWEQQTRLFYEKVPVIRYGDLHGLRAMRTSVKGFNEKIDRPRFHNVWLER